MHPIHSQQRRKQSPEHSQLSKTSAPASLSHRCAETWLPHCTCSAQCQPGPVPSTGSTAAHWGREHSASPSCLSAFAGQMRVVLTHPAVYGTSCPTGLSAETLLTPAIPSFTSNWDQSLLIQGCTSSDIPAIRHSPRAGELMGKRHSSIKKRPWRCPCSA